MIFAFDTFFSWFRRSCAGTKASVRVCVCLWMISMLMVWMNLISVKFHTQEKFERCHYVTWVFLVAIILNVLCNVLPSVYCSLKAIMSPLSGKSCGMWRGREFCTEWEPWLGGGGGNPELNPRNRLGIESPGWTMVCLVVAASNDLHRANNGLAQSMANEQSKWQFENDL